VQSQVVVFLASATPVTDMIDRDQALGFPDCTVKWITVDALPRTFSPPLPKSHKTFACVRPDTVGVKLRAEGVGRIPGSSCWPPFSAADAHSVRGKRQDCALVQESKDE